MKQTKKYLVAWVERHKTLDRHGNESFIDTDYYQVFIDGDTSIANFEDANELYNKLVNDDRTYSANITEIIASTDYDVTDKLPWYWKWIGIGLLALTAGSTLWIAHRFLTFFNR